jgi:hypothetical protein
MTDHAIIEYIISMKSQVILENSKLAFERYVFRHNMSFFA